MSPLTYQDVRTHLGTKAQHLLLGNGFSIACHKKFAYGSLFEFAKPSMGDRVTPAFERLGTNNFEGVMHLLEDAAWLVEHYGSPDAAQLMREDLEHVKNALVAAIVETHLERPGDVGESRLNRCVAFLEPFTNVFSISYDLLLYWVAMHGLQILKERDGFRNSLDEPDAPYCVFSEHLRGQKGILFVHGALHIYAEDGEVRKHTWTKSGVALIELVRNGLAKGEYPLFVAEGDSSKKRDQILHNGYLDYCFGKLTRIEAPLVTFGFSFGDSDGHILDAIVHNPKLEQLYVGVFEPESTEGKKTVAAATALAARRKTLIAGGFKGKQLDVSVFNSKTCSVWD